GETDPDKPACLMELEALCLVRASPRIRAHDACAAQGDTNVADDSQHGRDLMIELANVTKSYETGSTVLALNHITLEIGAAERVAVMGPSGSGKSTLLNLICGLDEPTSGSVKVDGVELSGLTDDERTRMRREKIGMVFQTFN